MQRDWELVRKILAKLEEQDGASGWLEPESVAGFDAETVGYHMKLMDEAGLIHAKSLKGLTSHCVALSLTWEGHEFLDGIRRDTSWNKAKGIAREKGLDLSFEVIKLSVKAAIEAMFQ